MASWCYVCRYKVDQHYVNFHGVKVHKKCMPTAREMWKEFKNGSNS
jgi:hypothetical protein